MMRFLKKLRVLALLIIMVSAVTNVSAASENNDFDWDLVVDAIIHVESRGNAWARNGQYVGVLQMSPVVVKAVNQILQKRGSRKRYTLKDRYSEKNHAKCSTSSCLITIQATMLRKLSACGRAEQDIPSVPHRNITEQ